MRERTAYLNARQTLQRLLEWSVVPVINENDTTATDEITFGDNDALAAQIAVLLGAERLVLLTNTDGLYTSNPSVDPTASLVSEVRSPAELEAFAIGADASALGTGGMRSKVVAAEMATAAGIEAVIASGLRPGVVTAAAAGEAVGTRCRSQTTRYSSFKLWLKYAKPAQGRVQIDDGAVRALREGGTSLLPVGVVAVDGEFDAGDAVEIARDGEVVGKGISNYSAAELRSVKGLKSDQVRARLPRATEEAVHRDYFVLA
jgi:glutamate 5-kinase